MARFMSSSLWPAGAMLACLGLTPHTRAPDVVTHAPRAHAPRVHLRDLDAMSDAELLKDLQDELDDVFEHHQASETADIASVQEAIMEALSDDGDTGDETEISFADLEAEMAEDDTDVKDVIHAALESLDQASLPRPTLHLASWNGAAPRPGMQLSYGLAVRDSRRALMREIRKKR